MNNPDLYVSMALDDVIKHRRKEGGRGGRGGRGRGGRGSRGGQQMFRNQIPRGGGGGFPQRSPGRVMKNRIPNQGPRQNMPFRGGRGGPMPQRGFPQPQRGRGAPRGYFNPRMGNMALTTNNPMHAGGRMRAWTTEVPQPRPMQPMAAPIRGRGRGGPRGGLRGRGRGVMQNRRIQQQQQQFQPQQQFEPQQQYHQQQQFHQQQFHQPQQQQIQPHQLRQQPLRQQPLRQQPLRQQPLRQQPQRMRNPNFNQVNKVAIAQELKNSTKTARNRVRLAAQVLMQRKRQLEQLTLQTAEVEQQVAFKPRGVRPQGATQRVTGLRRGGGVLKRQVDARTAIKQKIVRASVNRQRNLQRAQNQQMQMTMPNTRMHQQHLPPPPQPPQPMPARSLAAAAVRRAAAYRRGMGRGRGGMRGGMRGQKQLTLHERFSGQAY